MTVHLAPHRATFLPLAALDADSGAWSTAGAAREVAGFHGHVGRAHAGVYVRAGEPRVWLGGREWPLDGTTGVRLDVGVRRNALVVEREGRTHLVRYRRPWAGALAASVESRLYADWPVWWEDVDFGVFVAKMAADPQRLLEIWPFPASVLGR